MSTSRTALVIAPPVGADGARGAWLRSALQAQAGTMQTARQVALIALGGYGRDMVARRNHDPSAARVSSADQRVARELVALLGDGKSEEHTSELQSLMRISYAVFCLKKKTTYTNVQKVKAQNY